jgi:hypothetical protein
LEKSNLGYKLDAPLFCLIKSGKIEPESHYKVSQKLLFAIILGRIRTIIPLINVQNDSSWGTKDIQTSRLIRIPVQAKLSQTREKFVAVLKGTGLPNKYSSIINELGVSSINNARSRITSNAHTVNLNVKTLFFTSGIQQFSIPRGIQKFRVHLEFLRRRGGGERKFFWFFIVFGVNMGWFNEKGISDKVANATNIR